MSPLARSKRSPAAEIGFILHGPRKDDEADGGEEHDETARDAMKALIDAFKADDVDAALDAHKALCDLHMSDDDETEEDEEEKV